MMNFAFLSLKRPQRIGESDCLLKTQERAKS